MAEELISQYIDRAAIKADTDFLLAQLKSVYDAYTNLSTVKVNLSFSDGIKNTATGINQLNDSLKQTASVSQQANAALQKAASIAQQTSGGFQQISRTIDVTNASFKAESSTIEQNIQRLLRYEAELSLLSGKESQLEKKLAESEGFSDQKFKDLTELKRRQLELKQSISEVNAELKAQIQLDFAVPNTRAEARAQNKLLQAAAENTDINDTQRLAEINALIDRNNVLIDENSDKLARQKINIGNYPTAFSGAFKFLNDELAQIEASLSGPGLSGKEIDNLALKQQVLQNATALVGKEFSSTTAQQNAFNEAAKQIGIVFGADSETFKKFNTQVKQGKTDLDNVKTAMGGATEGGSKFMNALNGIWGGLRKIAYAIPGVGLAGLIGLLLTPLQALGAELIKYLTATDNAGKSTEDLNKKIETENKIITETKEKFSSAASNVAELKEQVALAKEGFLNKDQVVKQYNETMGKTVGTVKDLNEVEQELVKNGDAYIRFTLLKAAAQVAYGKAAEKAFEVEETARKKASDFSKITDYAFSNTGGSAEVAKKQAEERAHQNRLRREQAKLDAIVEQKQLEQIGNDFEKKAAEIAKKFNFNFFGDGKNDIALKNQVQKFFVDELKDQEAAYKKISESDTVYLNTRLQAREKAYQLEFQIIEREKNYEIAVEKEKLNSVLNSAKSSTNEKINARREYFTKVAEIDQKAAYDEKKAALQLSIDLGLIRRSQIDNDLALVKQEQEEIAEYDKNEQKKTEDKQNANFEKEKNAIQEASDYIIESYQREKNAKLQAASGDVERQRIEEEYNNKRKKKEIDTNIDIANSALALATLKLKLATENKDLNQVSKLEAQIASLKKQLEALKGESIDLDITKYDEKLNHLKDKISEIMSAIDSGFGAIGSFIDNGINAQKNALQAQSDLIDKNTRKQIEAVNASVLSEQDKAAKIAVINARAQAQKDQIEARQRHLDIQKAQFDKAKNIADAVGKTAVAVIAGLLEGGPVLAAIYGAIGAAEIAAAVAAPIPQYKTGTMNHPGGPFIAGDGGRSEMVIGPTGQLFTTPSVPTLYDMPRGTVVLPDANQAIEQSFNMMYKGITPAQSGNSTDMQLMRLGKKLDAVVNAIANIERTKVVNTWSGVNASYENVSRQWEYINRNTQS